MENEDFCKLCDKFQQQYGNFNWLNIVYLSLIICIIIFISTLIFSAPIYTWVVLVTFILIWMYFDQQTTVGLFLLALFLLVLLISPSGEETYEIDVSKVSPT